MVRNKKEHKPSHAVEVEPRIMTRKRSAIDENVHLHSKKNEIGISSTKIEHGKRRKIYENTQFSNQKVSTFKRKLTSLNVENNIRAKRLKIDECASSSKTDVLYSIVSSIGGPEGGAKDVPSNEQQKGDQKCSNELINGTAAQGVNDHQISFTDSTEKLPSSTKPEVLPSIKSSVEGVTKAVPSNEPRVSDEQCLTELSIGTVASQFKEANDRQSTSTDDHCLTENIVGTTAIQSLDGEQNEQQSSILYAENEISVNSTFSQNHKKRKRKRKPDQSSWQPVITKTKREHGEAYMGYAKTSPTTVTHNKSRPERNIGPRCTSRYCIKSKKRNCSELNEEQRINIFDKFWKDMSWDQKKIFIHGLVDCDTTKKKYVQDSRRSISLKYFIKINNQRKQVCKTFFLSTFGLKDWMVRNWVTNSTDDIMTAKKIQNKRRALNRPQPSNTKREFLLKFFDDLPKMPSHYCRQRTDKDYLEPNFISLAALYTYYCMLCKSNNIGSLSSCYFSNLFYDLKLSLYKPKKDRCDKCVSFDAKNMSEADYNAHFQQKERAREEKKSDKVKAREGKAHVFVMDVQAVQLCPVCNASALYFKTKLKVHNFSIYDLTTKECTCYWWHEGEGGMCASMFVSCIVKHLKKKCNDSLPVILWSDGCTYQNRNQILSNALLEFTIKHNTTVQQKFLIVGHTQMEVDNIHALIEKQVTTIDIPSDYITATKKARLSLPLEAELLSHNDFRNYDDHRLYRYNSIRPGNAVKDPKVTDLHVLSYEPNGKIYYKLNFDDELQELPRQPTIPEIDYSDIEPLFKEPPKISKRRFEDLQDLKTVLPKSAHSFYDNLSQVN